MDNHNNVVLFPGLKTRLEKNGMKHLQEKNYAEAMKDFEQLLSYGYNQPDILTGRLICLMELGRHDEAEEMSLQLLEAKDENYMQYLHIHLTLLFQLGRYEEVVDLLEEAYQNETIPAPLRTSFEQLEKVSRNMIEDNRQETAHQLVRKFDKAVEQGDYMNQWKIIQKCHALDISPHVQKMEAFLADPSSDPVVQTAVMEWMVKQEIEFPVTIHKLGETVSIIPADFFIAGDDDTTKGILNHLSSLEQENPSLFELIQKLLYRYLYVRYPFMPAEEDYGLVAKALQNLASSYLELETQELSESEQDSIHTYTEEIVTFEAKYLTVAEE